MGQQQQKPPDKVVNWPFIFCHVVGLTLDLLFHNIWTFGVRSAGPRLWPAVLVMFLWIACHPDDNCQPLFLFMILVIVLGCVAHFNAMLRHFRGDDCQSRYTGKPHLMRLLPQLSEITIKRIEPWIALLAGYGIHVLNAPLGSFVIAAAIGMGIRVGVEYRGLRFRSMNINDTLIDQKIVMDMARNPQRR